MLSFPGWKDFAKPETLSYVKEVINNKIKELLTNQKSEEGLGLKEMVIDDIFFGKNPPTLKILEFTPFHEHDEEKETVFSNKKEINEESNEKKMEKKEDNNYLPLRIFSPSCEGDSKFEERINNIPHDKKSTVDMNVNNVFDEGFTARFHVSHEIEGKIKLKFVLILNFPFPGFAEFPFSIALSQVSFNLISVLNYNQKSDFFQVFFEKKNFVCDFDFCLELGSPDVPSEKVLIDEKQVKTFLKDQIDVVVNQIFLSPNSLVLNKIQDHLSSFFFDSVNMKEEEKNQMKGMEFEKVIRTFISNKMKNFQVKRE